MASKKRGARQKYTDQQHYLVRALTLIAEASLGEKTIPEFAIVAMVGPLADGKPVPASSIEMCRKAARRTLQGKITVEKYFTRISESGRSKEIK